MALKNRARISSFPRAVGQEKDRVIFASTIQGHANIINGVTQELRLPFDIDGGQIQDGDDEPQNDAVVDEVLVVDSFSTVTRTLVDEVSGAEVDSVRFTQITYIRSDGSKMIMPIPDPTPELT